MDRLTRRLARRCRRGRPLFSSPRLPPMRQRRSNREPAIDSTAALGATSSRLPTVQRAAASRLSSRSSRPRWRRRMNSGVWSGSCTKTSSSTSSNASNEKTRGSTEARASLRVFANRDVSFQRRSEIYGGGIPERIPPPKIDFVLPMFYLYFSNVNKTIL